MNDPIAHEGQCEPSDSDIINEFIAGLENGKVMIHTNRVNGLGCYDTKSWGERSRRVLADALRKSTPAN